MSKQYKNLNINEKINAKSWGFWRMPNSKGFMLTMIDNAKSFEREDYALFTLHSLIEDHQAATPKTNIVQKKHIVNVFGIYRPFNKFVSLCQEIANEENTMMEVKEYPKFGWASITFMTDKFGGIYVHLHFDYKTRDVVNWYGHDDEIQIESVEQLKKLVRTEKEKILKERNINKVYEMVNAEY